MNRFSVPWELIIALVMMLIFSACDNKKDPRATSASNGFSFSQEAKDDWKAGKDPALVERVEYLTAQLDEYRQNLPPLDAFGYRPTWSGIWTGMVIICGHVVPPPYKIEYDLENDLVRLNGIELTYRDFFNVSGRCTAKTGHKKVAREHARYLAWKKKMSSVPAVREQCAKKKEIIDHGLEYFEKRIHELGIVVDEKSGQPNNWSLVFRACRDTKAELERVFGVDLERVELPKSKGDIFTFRLKRHVNLSPCNGGKLLILDTRFPDKLAWEKMSLHDSKTIAMNIKSAERQKNDLVKSWATIWRKWLLKGDILLFGPQDTSEYSNPASVAAIMKIFGQKMTPEEKFATLLAAGIGAINYRYIKNKSFLDFRSNETLIMIVLASQGNYKYDR